MIVATLAPAETLQNAVFFSLGQSQAKSAGADSRQNGGWVVRAEGGWGRATRSMPLRGGQVGSLKKGSLPVPGLQERQSSGRLLSGSRRAKVVRDSSKASIHCHDLMATSTIRRHVTREGRQLGCDRDSPPSPDELLMMMFYDVLLLDDNHCIYETYKHRRQRLTSVVHPVPGHAEIGERQKIDFGYADAPLQLAQHLAYEITQIWEGLVLKACQGTYILVQGGPPTADYISDSTDMVVVETRMRFTLSVSTMSRGRRVRRTKCRIHEELGMCGGV